MEDILRWWVNAGLIAFGCVWLGLSVLCIAALVFDCFMELETKLTTPLPMNDQPTTQSAGLCGLTSDQEISTRPDGGLTVRRRIKVNH